MGAVRYRQPRLRFRSPGYIYRAPWTAPPPGSADEAIHYGATFKLYDRYGTKLGEFTSDAYNSGLSKCTFTLLPSGPDQIEFDVVDPLPGVTLQHAQRVDVHVRGHRNPIYSGFLQFIPSSGTTEYPLTVKGFGFTSQLGWITIQKTFVDTTVWRIVDTLARLAEQRTGIVYNASKIVRNQQSLWPISYLPFLTRTPLNTALDQLASLAGGFIYGVDEFREFFFKPPDTSVTDESRLWVGENLQIFVHSEDSTNLTNRIWVVCGQRRVDTGNQVLPLPLDDMASQDSYYMREEIFSAPNVFDPADAYRAGAVELANKKDPAKSATVQGIDLQDTPIDCRGYVAITTQDCTVAPFPKASVNYTIDGNGIQVDMELSNRVPNDALLVAQITQAQANAELLQQIAQQQTPIG